MASIHFIGELSEPSLRSGMENFILLELLANWNMEDGSEKQANQILGKRTIQEIFVCGIILSHVPEHHLSKYPGSNTRTHVLHGQD